MTGLLLDTHVLVRWLISPEALTPAQAGAISEMEQRAAPLSISAITLWEIAQLVSRGRIRIHTALPAWLRDLEYHPLMDVRPLTAEVAAEGAALDDDFPKDPADRIIVATARVHRIRLATSDDRILRWGKVWLILSSDAWLRSR